MSSKTKAKRFTATHTVEAMQVSADWKGNGALLTWTNAMQIRDGDSLIVAVTPQGGGTMLARPGDWIVKGIFDDFFVRTADVFKREYKPA